MREITVYGAYCGIQIHTEFGVDSLCHHLGCVADPRRFITFLQDVQEAHQDFVRAGCSTRDLLTTGIADPFTNTLNVFDLIRFVNDPSGKAPPLCPAKALAGLVLAYSPSIHRLDQCPCKPHKVARRGYSILISDARPPTWIASLSVYTTNTPVTYGPGSLEYIQEEFKADDTLFVLAKG